MSYFCQFEAWHEKNSWKEERNVIVLTFDNCIEIPIEIYRAYPRNQREEREWRVVESRAMNTVRFPSYGHGLCIDRRTVFHPSGINVAVKSTRPAIRITIATRRSRCDDPLYHFFFFPLHVTSCLENARALLKQKRAETRVYIYACRWHFLQYFPTLYRFHF